MCLKCESFKDLMNFVPCQKQLECHQHILNKIKIKEQDTESHIFKHLHSTTTCFDSYNSLSFKILVKQTLNPI